MRAGRLVILSLLIGTPTILSAQTATDSMPKRGTWAADAFIAGGSSGANLLRFQSPRLAFLLGTEFNYAHTSDSEEDNWPFEGTSYVTTARLGVRSYRMSSSDHLRPIVGGGLSTMFGKSTGSYQTWTTGAYVEAGAIYFLTPHFSVGATGEVHANYGKTEQPNSTETRRQTTTSLSASLIRVLLSVYF